MPAPTATTKRATPRAAPRLSRRGSPATTARASCIAICRGIRRCSNWHAAGRMPQGAIVPALCAGTAAFARGDYGAAADKLAGALPELDRLGGSHAQREIFEDTYIAACLRAGRYDTAAERLSARLARRPSA